MQKNKMTSGKVSEYLNALQRCEIEIVEATPDGDLKKCYAYVSVRAKIETLNMVSSWLEVDSENN